MCTFLDVYVEKTNISFETSVSWKPTFTGQYLRWESFSPHKGKTILSFALVHRALMICIKRRLNEEIERIKKILLSNDYSNNLVSTQISMKIAQFGTLWLCKVRFGPEKCCMYLRVSCKGKPFANLEK